jgi:hypothetical protein
MVLEKELTIKELKHNIKEIEDDLDLYLTLKKINFDKTQPSCSKIKDVVTNRPTVVFDKFSHYVIKDEEYDETIYAKTQSLLAYQERLLKKIENIRTSDDKAYITYLREEERMNWNDIAKYTHYSIRQAQRIYNKL